MQLILKNSAAKIRATFTGADGEATEPTNPVVTITRNSDGEEIVTAQAATVEEDAAVGVVSYTLDPDDIPTVDLLTVEWSSDDASTADTRVGVVGGFLCSLEELDAAVATTLTTLELRELREEVEEKLETACNVAFRPSYARETLAGDGTNTLLLSHRRPTAILSATIDGEDVSADLTLSSGGVVVHGGHFLATDELDIAYSHGWPVAPSPVNRAAVKLAPAFDSGGDDRVNRFREDDQEFFLTVASGTRSTGIPEVDRVIRDYGYSPFF